MPAPYPRRSPERGVARAVNRGAAGMAQGRFAGLGSVHRRVLSDSQPPVRSPEWIYDGDTRCSFGCTDPGSIAPGDSDVSNTDGIAFTGTPDDYVDDTTYLRTGLYVIEGTIDLAGTAGDVVKVSVFVGNNTYDRFVTMNGSTIEYSFAETGPAAAGDFFIPWAAENLGGNSITANASGLGQLYPIILT